MLIVYLANDYLKNIEEIGFDFLIFKVWIQCSILLIIYVLKDLISEGN